MKKEGLGFMVSVAAAGLVLVAALGAMGFGIKTMFEVSAEKKEERKLIESKVDYVRYEQLFLECLKSTKNSEVVYYNDSDEIVQECKHFAHIVTYREAAQRISEGS